MVFKFSVLMKIQSHILLKVETRRVITLFEIYTLTHPSEWLVAWASKELETFHRYLVSLGDHENALELDSYNVFVDILETIEFLL